MLLDSQKCVHSYQKDKKTAKKKKVKRYAILDGLMLANKTAIKNSLGAMFFVMISSGQFRSFKVDLRNMFNVVGTFVLHAEDFQNVLCISQFHLRPGPPPPG